MSNNYLSRLSNEEFELQIESILNLVNRCHGVYSEIPIEWSFSRTSHSVSCVIPDLSTAQLLVFMALFSEVCYFPCYVDYRNLVICNY